MVRCLLFAVAMEIDDVLNLLEFGNSYEALFDFHGLGG